MVEELLITKIGVPEFSESKGPYFCFMRRNAKSYLFDFRSLIRFVVMIGRANCLHALIQTK